MTIRRSAIGLLAALLAGAPLLRADAAEAPKVRGIQAAQASAGPEQARAAVEALHDGLLRTMKTASGAGFEARRRALDPIVRNAFNLPAMAEIAAGSHWGRMSAEQQSAFVDVFARLSVANYANRFDGYSGESFETLGTQPGPRDAILVQTRLNTSSGSPVRLNYVTRNFGGTWQITDVFLDGNISELAVRRSEYTSILRSQGADALVQALERKITQLASAS